MNCYRRCTGKDSVELVKYKPEKEESGTLLESASQDKNGRQSSKKIFEDSLLQTIESGEYRKVEKKITPRALKNCESNTLLMGMKVNFMLQTIADRKGPDEERFNKLANSVENFTITLLDPLRADKGRREEFGDALDEILDDAILLQQKKFFTHPVVYTEMKRKWHGRKFMKSGWDRWRPLFILWCVFDLMFSPILYALCSLIRNQQKKKRERRKASVGALEEETADSNEQNKRKKTKTKKCIPVTKIYPICLETPYFKFARDTLSYLFLLVLHYALCLAPSSVSFSGLEWVILMFFIGRYLVERQQIYDVMKNIKGQGDKHRNCRESITTARKTLSMYQRDLWNRLDFISLLVYLVILTLRIASFIMSGSVVGNRVLVIAGYLYSFNTLCLTFRVFGHVMEQSRDVGTIQIALFSILKDVRTIFWQFIAAIMAFSIAITKVYMAEKSFVANGSDKNDIVCKSSGISCWWAMITHLGWSLLGASKESDPMASVDFPSVFIAQVLYAGFLIMGLILLVNMLIALLSNTYQRIKDNSLKEWSFKRAVTIQTYDSYDPIPVPLNIIYSILKLFGLVKGKDRTKGNIMGFIAIKLDRDYFKDNGNCFPQTGETKGDLVARETEKNRQMVSQILRLIFKSHGGDQEAMCSGQETWQVHTGIQVEGPLLTCVATRGYCSECKRETDVEHWPGARYCKAFSFEFPHFEVVILETGKPVFLGIGIVNESFNTSELPPWENGFVGYYTDGFIFDTVSGIDSRETEGPAIALRGDRIRCTVMFEDKQEKDGKVQVPVLFTLNGRKITIRGDNRELFVDFDHNTPVYPYIDMNDGGSVVAKMCPRDHKDYEASKIADFDRKFTEMKASLEETNTHLDKKVTEMKASLEETNTNLDRKVTEMKASLEETNRKLETLLARLPGPSNQEQGQG